MSATATPTTERAERRSAHEPRRVVHEESRPTGRQIYALCHALVDVAGLEWPETRAAASELLEHVRAQRDALNAGASVAAAAEEEIPF